MIKKVETLVTLEPIEHVYIHRITGVKYSSVTKAISSIEPHFDEDAVAEAIVRQKNDVKNPKYINLNKNQILDMWHQMNDEANVYGSKVHDILEQYLLSDGWYFPKDDFEKLIISEFDKINIDKGMYMQPERVLFSEEFELAGMSDLIIDIDDNFFDVGDYKGLPINTPIFTSNGWKTMGTLTLEDKVFDSDGCQTEIIAISDIKNKDCYEITFDTGEKIVSDFEHRWLVSFLREKKYKDVVMTTIELFNYVKNLPKGKKRHSWKIPKIICAKPLEINEVKLPIDPYVFGVWLGDGHSADGKITNMNKNVWSEIEKRGYKIGDDISGGGAGLASTRTVFGLTNELNKLGLLKNKHLPDSFLNSSFNQRLDILRGFMDSDGYFNKKRKRFVMSTTRKWQADAIKILVSSLGLKSTTLKSNTKLNGKTFMVYNVCFTSYHLNPFLVRNQDINIKHRNNTSNHRNILCVNKVESEPTICIEVKSPKHTFLFGHSFIVTHNTNKEFRYYNPYGHQTLNPPFDHLQCCQWSVYTLQLSIYAYMYSQETGKKCRQMYVLYWDRVLESFKKINMIYLKNEAKLLLQRHKYNLSLA